MRRGWKLIRNVLIIVVCLFLFWSLKGKPLPREWAYARAVQSNFWDDSDWARLWQDKGRILCRSEDALYLYQQDGWWVPDESIQQFPLENGMGYAMAIHSDPATPLEIFAYEDSGKAVMAELEYTLFSEAGREMQAHQSVVQKSQEIFHFTVTVEPISYTEDGRPAYDGNEPENYKAIYEQYLGNNIWQEYELTMTFYDADGNVVGEISEAG